MISNTDMLISPLNQYFGVIVHKYDLKFTDKRGFDMIKKLLYKNKVVVLKGISIEEVDYIRFAESIGSIVKFVDPQYHHPKFPEIFVVSNLKKEEIGYGKDRVGYYWHSDSSFMPYPLPITMLYSQIVPKRQGQTAFIDMENVYKNLPLKIKNSIKSKKSRHESKWKYLINKDDIDLSIDEILERDERLVPSSVHPLVVTHPVTKKESLYFSQGITRKILGLSEEKSNEFIELLEKIICQDPSYYEHHWEEGDIVIWDNRSVVHRAYPSIKGDRRLLYRIGVDDGKFY